MTPTFVRQTALAVAAVTIPAELVLLIITTHAMTLLGNKSFNATTAATLIHFLHQPQRQRQSPPCHLADPTVVSVIGTETAAATLVTWR